ncbi:MAG: hypothetical protein ACXAEU_08615 [Candidatus Hodarchaeales archaeon]|jgi:phenylacetate-CoA ligase
MRYSQPVREDQLASLLHQVIESTPYYREKFRDFSFYPFNLDNFVDLPITSNEDYHQITDPDDLYSDQQESHYAFIKEGTKGVTGASFWNINYLDDQIKILIDVFRQLGITQQDRIMNLLVPGISGSFHLYNLVLEKTGATIVPLGGESELPVIARFADDLQVNVFIGEPEFLVSVLEYLACNKPELFIEAIFILGENPTKEQHGIMKKYARNVYSPVHFSYETGIVGTQCPHVPEGTFHLSNTVHAELIDPESGNITDPNQGELVVTSLLDRASPCIRYRTGDQVVFLDNTCKCGNKAPLFKLIDSL